MTDSTTHLSDAQKGKTKREIDKADQFDRETSCIISDVLEIMNLRTNEILPTVKVLLICFIERCNLERP